MDLRVTIVQTFLHWENIAENLKHFDALLENVSETDLIVLPEMFTTGFSMNTKDFAEDMNGSAVQWMQQKASSKNAVLTGSVMIRENGKTFNRLLWVSPDGNVQHYDKRHLFRMGNEHEHYTAGGGKIFPELKGWKICPLICYDLRFPVWARNQSPHYDVLLYVANWPEARRHPWKTLLTARAIENQSYVIGVNRIGTDAREIAHAGDSCVCDPTGHWISNTVPYKESVETVLLSRKELDQFREKFPVLLDGDAFTIA
jgi:predicted amidohydrolase